MGIDFNTGQIHALYSLENWWESSNEQVYELAGGPGTGKTTLIRYLIDRLGLKMSDVAFIAFMGKAAMQMARHGLPAQTFHSFTYEYKKVLDLDEDGNMQFTSTNKPKIKGIFKLRDEPIKNVKLIVLDEVSMVNEKMAEDIMSFGIPIIVLGDINQLDPIFGKPYFLQEPDYVLTEIMRQAEDDPIVYLANRILEDKPLQNGVYGLSSVINKADMNDYLLRNADVVLTTTNKLRGMINDVYRKDIRGIQKLDLPEIGEKVVCRKNNWNRSLNDNIFLTNGMTGFVTHIEMGKFNGKSLTIDFTPDFIKKRFKNLKIDYQKLNSPPGMTDGLVYNIGLDVFEYAYALTVHMSQGSQYDNVVFLNQKSGFDAKTYKKLQYTAVTRAIKSITIVR